jgi:predicted DsbA family dithiol-disulfide isomerase
MILYSSATCPKCKVLKAKLDKANITYTVNENIEDAKELGIKSFPYLLLDDGTLLDFGAAVKFANGTNGEVTQQ